MRAASIFSSLFSQNARISARLIKTSMRMQQVASEPANPLSTSQSVSRSPQELLTFRSTRPLRHLAKLGSEARSVLFHSPKPASVNVSVTVLPPSFCQKDQKSKMRKLNSSKSKPSAKPSKRRWGDRRLAFSYWLLANTGLLEITSQASLNMPHPLPSPSSDRNRIDGEGYLSV